MPITCGSSEPGRSIRSSASPFFTPSMRIAGGAREARENLIVVESPDFLRASLHHRFAHRNLAVAGKRDAAVPAHKQDGRTTNFRGLFSGHEAK